MYNFSGRGGVAQLVEQRTHKPLVAGSSPAPATKVDNGHGFAAAPFSFAYRFTTRAYAAPGRFFVAYLPTGV